MLRRVHKLDPVRRVAQKGGAGRHGLQHPACAFLAQVVADIAARCHQAHQTFRLMRIQLVGHKHPDSLRVSLNRPLDMPCEVRLGPRWPERGREDLARRDVEVADQAQRAMARILKLPPLHPPWLHR